MGEPRKWKLGDQEMTPGVVCRRWCCASFAIWRRYRLQRSVDRAVISVPAWFREPQRRATVEAAQLAGIEPIRLINEPTAAGVGLRISRDGTSTPRCWCSTWAEAPSTPRWSTCSTGVAEVRASVGDSRLGGEDFTDAIVAWFAETHGVEASSELWARAEAAKRRLADYESASLQTPSGTDLKIDRERFEALTRPLLDRMDTCVTEVLIQAGRRREEVERVALVGGATRMKCFRDRVHAMFGNSPVARVDVDHVVAEGAAVQCGLAIGDSTVEDLVMTDVVPHSLGVRDRSGARRSNDRGSLRSAGAPRDDHSGQPPSQLHDPASQARVRFHLKIYQGEKRIASPERAAGKSRGSRSPDLQRGRPPVRSPGALHARRQRPAGSRSRRTQYRRAGRRR